jgi:prephenate dehydrogenase
MKIHSLAIVGVGLIGGSIALAARKRRLAEHIVGVGRRPEALRQAVSQRLIDEATGELAGAARQADLMVFCTPVDCIADQVLAAAPACKAGTLITDAGSTKARIVQALEGRLPAGVDFVGSHPLAGSEKRGWEHADAALFQDRLTLLTPGSGTNPEALERTAAFWRALGSRVRVMDPDQHDQALALTSHLPHLAAAALAGILPAELAELTATGFRDTTRVASGDPALWTAIFQENQAAVLTALARLQERLLGLRALLENRDWAALQQELAQAKKVRDALGS